MVVLDPCEAVGRALAAAGDVDLDGFPLERVVEIHVAGGSERTTDGFAWVEDDHTPIVLADTWTIVEHVIPRAANLKAVVFECERNSMDACLGGFDRLASLLAA